MRLVTDGAIDSLHFLYYNQDEVLLVASRSGKHDVNAVSATRHGRGEGPNVFCLSDHVISLSHKVSAAC